MSGLGYNPELGGCVSTGRNHEPRSRYDYGRIAISKQTLAILRNGGATPPAVVIGLTGYAQSGKDTSAGFMPGFRRLAFADKLKDLALSLGNLMYGHPDHGDLVCLPGMIEDIGWERAKAEVPGVRELLQNLGVGVRDVIGSDTWVRAVMDQVKPGRRYVITDVRFPNELEAIRAAGGLIVRVRRPGTQPPNAHVSESFDGSEADLLIDNDGDLDRLRAKALWVARLAESVPR